MYLQTKTQNNSFIFWCKWINVHLNPDGSERTDPHMDECESHLSLNKHSCHRLSADFSRQHRRNRGGSEPDSTAGAGPICADPAADVEERHRAQIWALRLSDHRSDGFTVFTWKPSFSALSLKFLENKVVF